MLQIVKICNRTNIRKRSTIVDDDKDRQILNIYRKVQILTRLYGRNLFQDIWNRSRHVVLSVCAQDNSRSESDGLNFVYRNTIVKFRSSSEVGSTDSISISTTPTKLIITSKDNILPNKKQRCHPITLKLCTCQYLYQAYVR